MVRKVKTLKEATVPIFWLNCVFCMGIFEIPVNRPRFRLSIAYVVSMLTGYFFVLYKGMIHFQETFGSDYIIFYFVFTINTLVAILAIILFWRKSENLFIILKRFSIVDVTFAALGIKKDYGKRYRHNVGLLLLWIAVTALLISMNLLWVYREVDEVTHMFHFAACFCIPTIINSVVDITFCSFLRCIHTKFQDINILLNNVVHCANVSNVFKIPDKYDEASIAIVRRQYKNHKDRIIHLIQTLQHLHLEITRIARQINHAYCLQLLLELAIHFTIVTTSSYCLYSSLSGHSLKMAATSEQIVAMFIWGCVYSFKIMLMTDVCTTVSSEAYRTGEIVQSFEGFGLDDDLRDEIHQFTQQIVLNSLNFTAAGFFIIDNSFTGKFFATVTTYVVILIQMNTPS